MKVTDNGVGMNSELLSDAVQLFETGKKEDDNSVGEKGVGLTFSIFQSDFAEIDSFDGTEKSRLVVKNARKWSKSTTDESLDLPIDTDTEIKKRGTTVILGQLMAGDLFNLTFK
ncbi:ATP-binding protein [Secundilactobacillus collinoides]|uniref:ATP-binding protein n=1 Tax=Secundilactobacillus collinoides TaxID=33960 RepID=UPI001F3F1E8B|nr:ATP-binding protein [Secundilactobacillus collinoides]